MTGTPAVVSWSGGKDSSLALQAALLNPALAIVGLMTTVTTEVDRISMHGVRGSLLRAQCASLELPLFEIAVPPSCSNEIYEAAMTTRLAELRELGVNDVVFGDLFLRDIREYRESRMKQVGVQCHFPLWECDTGELARRFIRDGFRAVLVCVDPKQLEPAFCGREFDQRLLAELPATCDPCGERGEFHTFVYAGPIFGQLIAVARGPIVEKGGFLFCDLHQDSPTASR